MESMGGVIGSEAFERMVCGWMRKVFEGSARMSFENFVLIYCSCFCVGLECEGKVLLPFREIL